MQNDIYNIIQNNENISESVFRDLDSELHRREQHIFPLQFNVMNLTLINSEDIDDSVLERIVINTIYYISLKVENIINIYCVNKEIFKENFDDCIVSLISIVFHKLLTKDGINSNAVFESKISSFHTYKDAFKIIIHCSYNNSGILFRVFYSKKITIHIPGNVICNIRDNRIRDLINEEIVDTLQDIYYCQQTEHEGYDGIINSFCWETYDKLDFSEKNLGVMSVNSMTKQEFNSFFKNVFKKIRPTRVENQIFFYRKNDIDIILSMIQNNKYLNLEKNQIIDNIKDKLWKLSETLITYDQLFSD